VSDQKKTRTSEPLVPTTAKKLFKAHPLALVESVDVGAGTRIWAFAHIMPGVRIGKDCNIGDHAFLETGVRIGRGVTIKNNALIWKGIVVGDYVFIGPNVVFTNDRYPRAARFPGVKDRYADESSWLENTEVHEGAAIGANSTICCGIKLGAFCMIGAGSVVTRDVPEHALVRGNPARLAGWVNKNGKLMKKTGRRWTDPDTGEQYSVNAGKLVLETKKRAASPQNK
jgi:acetyltransferase-like isoleucine patch superfamily enzyme